MLRYGVYTSLAITEVALAQSCQPLEAQISTQHLKN